MDLWPPVRADRQATGYGSTCMIQGLPPYITSGCASATHVSHSCGLDPVCTETPPRIRLHRLYLGVPDLNSHTVRYVRKDLVGVLFISMAATGLLRVPRWTVPSAANHAEANEAQILDRYPLYSARYIPLWQLVVLLAAEH